MKDITHLFKVDETDPMDRVFIHDDGSIIRRPVSCSNGTESRMIFIDGIWVFEERTPITEKIIKN